MTASSVRISVGIVGALTIGAVDFDSIWFTEFLAVEAFAALSAFSSANRNAHSTIPATISIPKINIEVPILLGANTANMKKGAVHLTETSYPIGGVNTNSVIAAHRGYGKATLFRYIDKIGVGDKIRIRNFKEELTYEVYETKIINPDDISELEIQEGQDIITLITCHPYRINTQRYIVKAKRV